jgi:hypothetical protein
MVLLLKSMSKFRYTPCQDGGYRRVIGRQFQSLSSQFLLFLSARLTWSWLHFLDSSPRFRYMELTEFHQEVAMIVLSLHLARIFEDLGVIFYDLGHISTRSSHNCTMILLRHVLPWSFKILSWRCHDFTKLPWLCSHPVFLARSRHGISRIVAIV